MQFHAISGFLHQVCVQLALFCLTNRLQSRLSEGIGPSSLLGRCNETTNKSHGGPSQDGIAIATSLLKRNRSGHGEGNVADFGASIEVELIPPGQRLAC